MIRVRVLASSDEDYARLLNFLSKREAVIEKNDPKTKCFEVQTTEGVLSEIGDRVTCDHSMTLTKVNT